MNRLYHTIHNISKAIAKKKKVPTVFLDISKAFDRVWHDGLIFKLRRFGIEGTLLEFFKSYLTNRKQRVAQNGVLSEVMSLFAGVPQGSILGPILFLIFINDIVDEIESVIALFADDTNIGMEVAEFTYESVRILQRDLIKIEAWANKWLVTFNVKKTVCIVFSNRKVANNNIRLRFLGEDIKMVENHKHLGVILTRNLDWELHIDEVIRKAQYQVNVMKKYKYYYSRETLKKIYIYHVKSLLLYADILYPKLSAKLEAKLEKIQYRAMLVICGAPQGTSSKRMLEELDFVTLSETRRINSLVNLYKMMNNKCPEYLSSNLPPRQVPYARRVRRLRRLPARDPHRTTLTEIKGTLKYMNSCMLWSVKQWNLVDITLRIKPSVDSFRHGIKKVANPQVNDKKFFSLGSRMYQCILSQFRLKTHALNQSLYSRNLLDSPNCNCQTGGEESPEHFLLLCDHFANLRNNLTQQILNLNARVCFNNLNNREKMHWILYGNKNETIVWNTLFIKLVLTFIEDTARFYNN